ncbi:phosphatase 2C-like domain-containing protein [Radiomyces spectabilis]|uniref:phosphatase 2C-like domain-containing protein n=1 Tax=Radiomyces spectabilis TaxID=64574 RepID=UPI00221ED321|nr:phosphatase 2C-like domain-containing protein [Radiomyces spectabilis]KAI8379555.1 phosphatase 2C-like domain-containing protein [Radiomyces spectabilis]
MGQTLSEPITTKSTTSGNDKRVMYGASAMQGWRITMEDAHTTIPEYTDTGASFFAVFDGHGGSNVAKYSGEHLQDRVLDSDDFRQGKIREALKAGYLGIDEDLRKDPQYEHETSGCTAVVALLTKDNILYVGNAGDSRAVISANGKAIALSQDHKPTNAKETARIEKAGGHVEAGRVNGNLALSRALGDFEFKQNDSLPAEEQAVTANPDVTDHKLTKNDEFIIVACDGIWDCLTNQEAVNFVRKGLSNKKTLATICEEMMDECLADESDLGGVGCDNMTVIIVAFLHDMTPEEWYDSMAGKFVKTGAVVARDLEEPEPKKPRGMKSESKEYTVEELRNAGDLTSSLDADKETAAKDAK